MKDLKNDELFILNGGGFSYDVGCAWRYVGHYTYGFFKGGGLLNPISGHVSGSTLANATKCP